MFRRIEMIHEGGSFRAGDGKVVFIPSEKWGLVICTGHEMTDAWIHKLRGPGRRSLPRNAKFYFTETGWKEVGRHVVAVCLRTKHDYRIIRTKEAEVNVVWRDRVHDYEVAAQPKKRMGPSE